MSKYTKWELDRGARINDHSIIQQQCCTDVIEPSPQSTFDLNWTTKSTSPKFMGIAFFCTSQACPAHRNILWTGCEACSALWSEGLIKQCANGTWPSGTGGNRWFRRPCGPCESSCEAVLRGWRGGYGGSRQRSFWRWGWYRLGGSLWLRSWDIGRPRKSWVLVQNNDVWIQIFTVTSKVNNLIL